MAKRVAEVFAGLKTPRQTCPFSGTPLQIVPISGGKGFDGAYRYQVRGKGWVGTELFSSEAAARYAFSFEAGVPPAFRNPDAPAVEAVRVVEPPDEGQAAASAAAERAVEQGETLGEELAKETRDDS